MPPVIVVGWSYGGRDAAVGCGVTGNRYEAGTRSADAGDRNARLSRLIRAFLANTLSRNSGRAVRDNGGRRTADRYYSDPQLLHFRLPVHPTTSVFDVLDREPVETEAPAEIGLPVV